MACVSSFTSRRRGARHRPGDVSLRERQDAQAGKNCEMESHADAYHEIPRRFKTDHRGERGKGWAAPGCNVVESFTISACHAGPVIVFGGQPFLAEMGFF